jgi:hypothetical protein
MVGLPITGSHIPSGAYIIAVASNGESATLSANATTTSSTTATINPVTPTNPANLTASTTLVSNASYRACSAPCMTTIALSNDDSSSSPFVDYTNDAIYVGDSNGDIYKFSGVFKGTPGLVSGWPLAASTGHQLTSPVYDPTSTDVFFGDSAGYLYSYSTGTTPALVAKSSQLAITGSKGIVDGPLIDSSAGSVYVFVGQDGNTVTNHNCDNATGCDGVFRFSTGFTSGTGTCSSSNGTSWTSGTSCGQESVFGVGTSTTTIYSGTPDNAYYSTGTGNLWTCAATGTPAPKLDYSPITSSGFSATVSIATNSVNPLAGAAATCSPVTEFDNGSDHIYLSVTAGGNQTSCSGACIYSFTISGTAAALSAGLGSAGGSSGIIIDNSAANGGSQIYFSYLSAATSSIKCPAPSSATAGGCAVQASQAALK